MACIGSHAPPKVYQHLFQETFEKPIATFQLLDSVSLMAKFSVPKEPKQKRGRPSKRANKRSRNYNVGLKHLMSYAPFVVPDLNVI